MIFRSPYRVDIPVQDILTFLFSRDVSLEEKLWISSLNPSNYITKGEGLSLVKRIGYGLRKLGVGASGRGKDVVLSFVENQIMNTPSWGGVLCAGGIFATCAPTATVFELTRQLKGSRPKAIICSKQTLAVAEQAVRASNLSDIVVLILDSNSHDVTFRQSGKSLLERNELEWERITDLHTLENTTVCLVYSSGTTGVPKGVKYSHRNLVANTQQICFYWDLLRATLAAQGLKMSLPGMLPNSAAGGILIHSCMALRLGMQVYLYPKYEFKALISYIRDYKLTVLMVVPTIWRQIAYSSDVTARDLESVHIGMSGAAPMSVQLQKDASAKLPAGRPLRVNWGMTEATCEVAQFLFEEIDSNASVGRLLPNIEAKVISPQGAELGPDQEGEIILRGPNITKGYFNNAEATAGALKDGWLHTGDIVKITSSGKIFIVGRSKELIKYKGNQVPPSELEDIILTHPAVKDVAVIGIPTDSDNELARAYVVKKTEVTAEDIMKWVNDRVSRYKQLRGGVVFIDDLPRNAIGKLTRGVLKEWAAQNKHQVFRARL